MKAARRSKDHDVDIGFLKQVVQVILWACT
jgi:hypothetical protein